MKRFGFLVVATVVAGGAVVSAQEQPGKTEAILVSADKAVFKEVVPGEPEKGPHGAFTKFVPGFDAGVHTHTSDLRLVVIKGAYLYRADGRETRVGPGEHLFIPGGTKHWSGGDPKEGALFYQEGLAKFDLNPVK
jgi:quercetin dioxygenase-like cupin family protein